MGKYAYPLKLDEQVPILDFHCILIQRAWRRAFAHIAVDVGVPVVARADVLLEIGMP